MDDASNVLPRILYDPTKLRPHEEFWRDHQPWLQQCGYMLRPRYKSDWKPVWAAKDPYYMTNEDSIPSMYRDLFEATRISDGK
ncbi:hypothetical protein C8Q75DRAFT_808141 [Abortiporus biennis]|nr:hypothetical protein C8Q75DRAFT_808141 [Abortiporus biennis]